MKLTKLSKALAIFSATAMLFTSFVSCSDSGDDDNNTENNNNNNNNDNNNDNDNNNNGGGDNNTGGGSEDPFANYNDSSLAAATLWVVGDSTVCDYEKADGTHTDATYFYPRYGYGTQFKEYLSSKITVKNIALSGRSSKSFMEDPEYAALKSGIKAGDFLVIGFGHNDEKSAEPARFTDASKPSSDSSSFGYSIYNNYIKIAEDAGATAIVCSPICRASSTNAYDGSYAHITSTGDYGKAAEDVAKEHNVQFVDLRGMTKELYTEIGYTEAIKMHAVTSGTSTDEGVTVTPKWESVDTTHINIFGAKMVSYMFAKTIYESSSSLKPYVKSLYKPTEAKDLVKGSTYKWVAYKPADWSAYAPGDNFKMKTAGWYGTAMGYLGGESKIPQFFATESTAGTFKVGQSAATGKITASADGIAFAFQQLPIKKNFTLTAKAKVTAVDTSKSQAGFGLMLRDDCYTPVNDQALGSNYVAAGFVAVSTSAPNVNFKRETGALVGTDTISGMWALNDEATFTIERIGQTVNVTTVYKGETYTQKYTDFDFVAKDNDYFYAGMFATRGTLVEFTDVNLTITGDSQGA